MNARRRLRLWTIIVELAHARPAAMEHVGAAVITTAGVDAVAVAVSLTATPRETVYASNGVATALEDLALTIGEGPTVEALHGETTLVPDLNAANSMDRWPAFAPAATDAGVRAVFAVPLRVGAIRLGVMDLYRAAPGALDGDALADTLLLADMACAFLLDAGPGAGAGTGDRPVERTALHHPQVHQATGMITVQLGVTAAVALIRLRAYAYAADRGLQDVAGDVVSRHLRFDPDPGPERGPG
jgi:hypothetical protein